VAIFCFAFCWVVNADRADKRGQQRRIQLEFQKCRQSEFGEDATFLAGRYAEVFSKRLASGMSTGKYGAG
jgi:hypothetical protein